MKKRTIYITLFLIFIIGVISLIGTFAIDSTITEGISSKADYLFNITLGDRTNREIVIPGYDSKIVDIKISNPNEFNMSYLLYLEGVNSNLSIINISNNEASGVLNSKTNTLIKVFIQNNSGSDITTSIKDIVGFEKEKLSVPSNNTSINKGTYYKVIVKSNDNTYGKVKPNIKLSTSGGTVKYTLVPNTGYQYKSTTCNGTVSNNILTISNITSNTTCEVVFEPIEVTITYNYRNNIYNQDTSSWIFSNSSKIDNNYSYNGALGISVTSNDAFTGVFIPINEDKKENTNYILSVKAYRTIEYNEYLRVYAPTQTTDYTLINWFHGITAYTDNLPINTWKEYSYKFNSASYNRWEYIKIDFNTANQGPVYISDIRLDEYEERTISYNQKYGTLPTPTRTNYIFDGWYTEPNGKGTKITSETVLTSINNQTLYANWTIDKVKITLNLNGGLVSTSFTNPQEYTYTIPYNGTYWLETWGAQGGNYDSTYVGGYGGYSSGTVYLYENQNVYVNIGGAGTTASNYQSTGGYNGGGSAVTGSTNDIAGSGGGATHIATRSGLLSSLSNHRDNILIVSGGGGGAYYFTLYNSSGGHAGGITGGLPSTGTCEGRTLTIGSRATQTSAGSNSGCPLVFESTAGFGQGSSSSEWSSGGGAGYYGGGSSYAYGSSGGTGYIGNSQLTNKVMYCYECEESSEESTKTISTACHSGSLTSNCAKEGNGGAIISLVDNVSFTAKYGEKYSKLPTPTKNDYLFAGWYTEPNGKGTRVTNKNYVSIASDHTLYAYWTNEKYYLDLNGFLDNNGSGNIEGYGTADVYIDDVLVCDDCTDFYAEYPYGTEFSITDIKTLTGHTYNGIYDENGKYSSTTSGIITKATYVFLNYTTNTYYITYDANGGIGAPEKQAFLYNSSGTISTIIPTRPNYTFLYWTSAGNNNIFYPGAELPKNWESFTLIANWTTDATPPTCSLSANSSTISASASDNVGLSYQGWDSSYSGTSITSKDIASGTHTYYVKDTAGNTNTCSINISGLVEKDIPYTETSAAYANYTTVYSGSCRCSKKVTGGTSYVEGYCNPSSGCSCPGGTSISSNSCIGTKKVTGYYCPGNGTVSGSTCIYTKYKITWVCPDGYSGVSGNSNFCYKY